MSDCERLGPGITALLRGEADAEEAGALRAHLAACAGCRALEGELLRVRAALDARVAPAASPGSRARLRAALHAAMDGAPLPAGRPRGIVLRMFDRAGERYAESRMVRFLTLSLGAHAAAALLIFAWWQMRPEGPAAPAGPRTVEIADTDALPPLPDEEPFAPSSPARPSLLATDDTAAADALPSAVPWLAPSPEAGAADALLVDPPAAFPTEAFRAYGDLRFRRGERERALAAAWGEDAAARVRAQVDRTHRWLAAEQEPDGTWASGPAGASRAQRDRFRIGTTGVVLQAFLGAGHTGLRTGPYRGTVLRGVEALARSQDLATGLLGAAPRGAGSDAERGRPLCNHAPALAALAEWYGLDYALLGRRNREQLAEVIERAVKYTVLAQRPDGSFGYVLGAPQGDSSVTLLQVEALALVARAGFPVDPAVLRRAGEFLRARIGPDGRLGYRTAGDRSQDATLTAQALAQAGAVGIDASNRGAMLRVVLEESGARPLGTRVLFRAALLEALASSGDPAALARAGPGAALATLDRALPSGAFPAAGDPYAVHAGDALAAARAVRSLTAPWRAGG